MNRDLKALSSTFGVPASLPPIQWPSPKILPNYWASKFPWVGFLSLITKSPDWHVTGFLHFTECFQGSSTCQPIIPSYCWIAFHRMDRPHFVCLFTSWWTFKLFPAFGYYEQCHHEHLHVDSFNLFFLILTVLWGEYPHPCFIDEDTEGNRD